MEVTVAPGLILITKSDDTTQAIPGQEIVDLNAVAWKQYNTVPPSTSDPYAAPTSTSVWRYKVIAHLTDNREQQFQMGSIGNQAGWTDDETGVLEAVTDLAVAFGMAAPTIAFTLSSGSVNGDYVFSHIGTNVEYPTGDNYFWIQPGGDVDTDYVVVQEGGTQCNVWQGGVEMYLGLTPGTDPFWPPDFTDWIPVAGIEPTPTFS